MTVSFEKKLFDFNKFLLHYLHQQSFFASGIQPQNPPFNWLSLTRWKWTENRRKVKCKRNWWMVKKQAQTVQKSVQTSFLKKPKWPVKKSRVFASGMWIWFGSRLCISHYHVWRHSKKNIQILVQTCRISHFWKRDFLVQVNWSGFFAIEQNDFVVKSKFLQ